MDRRGRNKRVDTARIGTLKGFRSAFYIATNRTGETTDATLSNATGNRLNGFEVALAGNRETRFDNIDAHFFQRYSDTNFFIFGHRCAGALFTVTQGCIKNN